MNALASITIEQEKRLPSRSRWDGDIFRSRLIDKLAQVEAWAVDRLRAAQDGKKLPGTSGLRLGAVRKLTDTHPDLFRKAATAARLLDEIRIFQDMRSHLAHSKLTRTQAEDRSIWVFERADSDPAVPWSGRLVIRECESCRIIKRVSDLAHQLSQQTPSSRT
ncbi:MAG TPA: hypothetical protein VK403_08905 [Allosphingosinicella sp.]|nr:hypothetical protein [Allosphingosinicella sp.]